MIIKFRAYQAKNGRVYLTGMNGRCHTALELKQVTDLGIDLYSLDEFDLEQFKKAYSLNDVERG